MVREFKTINLLDEIVSDKTDVFKEYQKDLRIVTKRQQKEEKLLIKQYQDHILELKHSRMSKTFHNFVGWKEDESKYLEYENSKRFDKHLEFQQKFKDNFEKYQNLRDIINEKYKDKVCSEYKKYRDEAQEELYIYLSREYRLFFRFCIVDILYANCEEYKEKEDRIFKQYQEEQNDILYEYQKIERINFDVYLEEIVADIKTDNWIEEECRKNNKVVANGKFTECRRIAEIF